MGEKRIATHAATPPLDEIDALILQARECLETSPGQSLALAQQALAKAEEDQQQHKIANACYRIGQAFLCMGNLPEALEMFKKGVLLAQDLRDNALLAKLCESAGEALHSQNDPEHALKFHLRAITLYEHEGDLSGICTSHNHLGSLYARLGQFREALQQFTQAHKLAERLADRRLMGMTLMNIGKVHGKQGHSAQASEYLEHALEVFEELEWPRGTLDVLVELGGMYCSREQWQEAERFYLRAGTLADKTNRQYVQSVCALELGNVYLRGGDPDVAYKELARGLTIARRLHANDLILQGYHYFAELFARRADYRQSLEYYRKFIDLKEEVNAEASRHRLHDIQMSYMRNNHNDKPSGGIAALGQEQMTQHIIAQRDKLTIAYEELRVQGEKLNAVFHNAVVGISIMDRFGQYRFINSHWANMLGYTTEEVYRLKNLKVTHPEDAAESFQLFIDLVEGRISRYTVRKRYIRKDESIFWGQLSASPIHDKDGNVEAMVGIIVDIDEQVRSELALHELEKKNAALALAVTANHEINQPLQLLRSNLEMLDINAPDSVIDEHGQKYLERMHQAIDRISSILESFRSSSSIRFDEYTEDTEMVVFEGEPDA